MREISRMKKLEVAQYYILGCPYSEIESKTGVSHGTIVNIVKELECVKLTIPGTPFDQVSDLRQLSLELKKRGLASSQALLGILLFDRFRVLEITPELVDKWSELAKKLLPVDFPANDFLEAALKSMSWKKASAKPLKHLLWSMCECKSVQVSSNWKWTSTNDLGSNHSYETDVNLTLKCFGRLGHNGISRINQCFGDCPKGSVLYVKGLFGTSSLELRVSCSLS